MAKDLTEILQKLDLYERKPGKYHIYQLKESNESFDGLVEILESLGFESRIGIGTGHARSNMVSWYRTGLHGRTFWMPLGQWQVTALKAGDYVTIREDWTKPNAVSIITYLKDDFEERYRKPKGSQP